jgi:hypothetical protein
MGASGEGVTFFFDHTRGTKHCGVNGTNSRSQQFEPRATGQCRQPISWLHMSATAVGHGLARRMSGGGVCEDESKAV